MKKVFFLTLSIFFAAAFFPNCASSPDVTQGHSDEYVDDLTITKQVHSVIVRDLDARSSKIEVDTTHGDIMLMGSVNSKLTEERLIGRIKQIKGVKSVRSVLKIEEKK